MVALKAVLLTPSEQDPWKAKIFRVDVRQWLENHFFLSSSTGGCSYGLSERSFLTNPTKVPRKKGGNFSLEVGIW